MKLMIGRALGSVVRAAWGVAAPAAGTVLKAVLPGIVGTVADKAAGAITNKAIKREVAKVQTTDAIGDQIKAWLGQCPNDLAILIAAGAIVYGFFRRPAAPAVAAAPAAVASNGQALPAQGSR